MSEAKFTKGPWEVRFNSSWYEIRTTDEFGGDWIADTCASSCQGDLQLGMYNAHIIAAAPEVYEFIETYMGGHPEAEQLLAKARGESQ